MAAKNPTGEPDPAPFKVYLMTRAGRVMRARSESVDPIGKSHFHALWLLSSGYEVEEVAELLSQSEKIPGEMLRFY